MKQAMIPLQEIADAKVCQWRKCMSKWSQALFCLLSLWVIFLTFIIICSGISWRIQRKKNFAKKKARLSFYKKSSQTVLKTTTLRFLKTWFYCGKSWHLRQLSVIFHSKSCSFIQIKNNITRVFYNMWPSFGILG